MNEDVATVWPNPEASAQAGYWCYDIKRLPLNVALDAAQRGWCEMVGEEQS